MLLKGIDFPSALLRAPERGTLVVFAGAGVSMGAPASYPSFVELARDIGSGSPLQRDNDERAERYLGRLQNAGVAVHDRAVDRLTDATSQPTGLHQALLSLFPSSGELRIVTTNFDDHFSSAATLRFPGSPVRE